MLFGDTTSRDCQLMAIYLSSTVVAKSLAMTFMMMIVQAAVVAPLLLLVSILPGSATAASSFSLPVIDISGYSTTFRKCHELISEVNDGPQQIIQRYVEIDLCLNGNDYNDCESSCTTHMVDLIQYINIISNYHYQQQEEYCTKCKNNNIPETASTTTTPLCETTTTTDNALNNYNNYNNNYYNNGQQYNYEQYQNGQYNQQQQQYQYNGQQQYQDNYNGGQSGNEQYYAQFPNNGNNQGQQQQYYNAQFQGQQPQSRLFYDVCNIGGYSYGDTWANVYLGQPICKQLEEEYYTNCLDECDRKDGFFNHEVCRFFFTKLFVFMF